MIDREVRVQRPGERLPRQREPAWRLADERQFDRDVDIFQKDTS